MKVGERSKTRKPGSLENKTASTSRPTRLVSLTNPSHPGPAWSVDVRKASSGWDGSALRYLRQTRRIGQLFLMGTRGLDQPEPVNITSRGPSCATSRSEATGEKTSLFGKGFFGGKCIRYYFTYLLKSPRFLSKISFNYGADCDFIC